jgi:AraC-type DNA-binding domain-containing proteins
MMTQADFQKEITPISQDDLFIVLDRPDANFDYPTHYHTDYELNMVINSQGKRIIGDSISEFNELDLVLLGPNLPHKWQGEIEKGNHVVTIQFHEQLLDYPILTKRLFNPIKELLQRSSRGIEFSEETKKIMKNKILGMTRTQGFDTALQFLSILYELSVSRNQKILADPHFSPHELVYETKSRRINKVCEYVNNNYFKPIKLADIASLIGMSESAFSHFFKKKTQRNFIDYVNDIRIGYASQMLFETTHSIAEVCYSCGFNNISNFIRVFKKKKGETPGEYRLNIKKILTKF